ncbi:MAG: hypothetical protein FWB75_06180 [Oscillospiraceae bacterium]|nr:hypothetical protein [Oscillospiraceae bacterium]
MKSSRSSHLEAVAYSPVYITDKLDDMSTVHTNARFLNRLQEHGLVTLNYDEPLESYDYEFFYESSAYEYFTETVREGKQNQGFIFDTAIFELGHIALTGSGQDLATSL